MVGSQGQEQRWVGCSAYSDGCTALNESQYDPQAARLTSAQAAFRHTGLGMQKLEKHVPAVRSKISMLPAVRAQRPRISQQIAVPCWMSPQLKAVATVLQHVRCGASRLAVA